MRIRCLALAALLVALLSLAPTVPASAAPTLSRIGKAHGDTIDDTFLYSSRPTAVYGASSMMAVGRPGSGEERMLLRYPLAKVAGSSVLNATLHLTRSGGATSPFTLRAYRLNRSDVAWPEATWGVYRAGASWAVPGAGGAGSDYRAELFAESSSYTDFEVTALARAALAEGQTTLDLLIVDPAPVPSRYVSLYSSEVSIPQWAPVLDVATR